MNAKKLYVLDAMDSSIQFNANDSIISLCPEVSYVLDKSNIPYCTVEDYLHLMCILDEEEQYFVQQLDFFLSFDTFLKSIITFVRQYDMNLASACYLRWKYFVDTLVIYSRIFTAIIQEEKPKKIVWVSKVCFDNTHLSVFNFLQQSNAVVGQLLRLVCENQKISFQQQILYSKKNNEGTFLRGHVFLGGNRVKAFLKTIRNIFIYRKYQKKDNKKSGCVGLKILFMHAGSAWIDLLVREMLHAKADVYLQEKDNVVYENKMFSRSQVVSPEVDNTFRTVLKQECRLKKETKALDLVSWVSEKSGLDVSSIVLPYLEYFIAIDCFDVLLSTKKKMLLYEKHKINYVVARGNTDKNSLGNLLAAQYSKKVKSVGIQHACFFVKSGTYGIFETVTYDVLFACNKLFQSYYEQNSVSAFSPITCNIAKSNHYLDSLGKRFQRKTVQSKGKETIVYVPKKTLGLTRVFDGMDYPINWYFKLQKNIIDFFAAQKDYMFIYKHAKGQEWAEKSIIPYINETGCRNIKVVDCSFINVLKKANRVVLDYPSTGLFEAAATGKPVLSLYYNKMRVVEGCVKMFGKSTQPFSSFDEVESILQAFLMSNGNEYKVNFPSESEKFVDVMEKIL